MTTSETIKRASRVRLAQAFSDLARQPMPFAAAASAVGETGPGSLSNRAAQVYGHRTDDRNGSEPDRIRHRS